MKSLKFNLNLFREMFEPKKKKETLRKSRKEVLEELNEESQAKLIEEFMEKFVIECLKDSWNKS